MSTIDEVPGSLLHFIVNCALVTQTKVPRALLNRILEGNDASTAQRNIAIRFVREVESKFLRNVANSCSPWVSPTRFGAHRRTLFRRYYTLGVLLVVISREMGQRETKRQRWSVRPLFDFRVVVRLGSTVPFSQELNELQEEVKPLWKMPSCPRDFKRTSVEILFREAEFRLDWCSFRLVSRSLGRTAVRNSVCDLRYATRTITHKKCNCKFPLSAETQTTVTTDGFTSHTACVFQKFT